MSRFILGLHVGHNASACIGDRDGLTYAIQEERLNGEKNYWGFPSRSVKACLEAVGARTEDLAGVAVGSRFILHRHHTRADVVESYEKQRKGIGYLRMAVAVPLALTLYPKYGQAEVREGLEGCGLGGVPVEFYDHHRAHAASAYYGLRKDAETPYLVVTCDGSGDRLSGSVRVWSGKGEEVVSAVADANSLGALYALVTHAMGFVPLEHEYKLMGMAPYASPAHAEEAMRLFASYLELDDRSLTFRRKGTAPTYLLLRRILSDISGRRFDSVCAGLQRFTEDLLSRWVARAIERTGVPDVLAAGGVFMNVKANKVIAGLSGVATFEAFPSCGDETLSMGAFWLESARRFGDGAVSPLAHFYLGDDLDAEETGKALAAAGYPFERLVDPAETVAELLARGEPVARCAGRMEFGARALCNRSILADPRNQDVVRVINQMVKKRDFWMPFAPVMLASRQHEYLENAKGLRSPYMMMTFDTKASFPDMIAAVHNADLTCRAQLLEPGQNPAVEATLNAFERRTGRAVLLNTSFNLHGFPIVRTAADALHVFRSSGLRFMQVGEYLVRKEP